MDDVIKNDNELDLNEAYFLCAKDQDRIVSIRVDLLHLLDKYSNNNISSLLNNSKRAEHYVITGDIIR